MTAPYELKSPDGVTRWWACGVCHFVGSFGNQCRVWRESDADYSRETAERCCTCRTCGVVVEHDAENRRWSNLCVKCNAAWEAQRAADDAAREAKAAEITAAVEDADESERWAFLLGNPPTDGAEDSREFVEVVASEILSGVYVCARCVVNGTGYSYECRGDFNEAVAGLQGDVTHATQRLVTPLTPAMRELRQAKVKP